jgi:Zn-dependent protease with chaperone function
MNMMMVAFSKAYAAASADPLRFAADSSFIICFPMLAFIVVNYWSKNNFDS